MKAVFDKVIMFGYFCTFVACSYFYVLVKVSYFLYRYVMSDDNISFYVTYCALV